MKIGAHGREEFRRVLSGRGACIRTGPIVTQVRTPLPCLADGIRFLYSDYPLEEDCIAHFRVSVRPPRGLRRYWRRQVFFHLDGISPFLPFPRRLALPLLEWGMNWCAHTHMMDHLILHAAAVERGGRGIILAGTTGSGKSTLCAALLLQGWRLLSDEMALVRTSDGALQAIPRPVGLKDESIQLIRQAAATAPEIGPESSDTHKGTVAHLRPPSESITRWQETARPRLILFPLYERGAAPNCVPIPPTRAFLRLAADSFNYARLGIAGFEALAQVIESCACYDLSYASPDQAVQLISQI